jgi:hypothetical protein
MRTWMVTCGHCGGTGSALAASLSAGLIADAELAVAESAVAEVAAD